MECKSQMFFLQNLLENIFKKWYFLSNFLMLFVLFSNKIFHCYGTFLAKKPSEPKLDLTVFTVCKPKPNPNLSSGLKDPAGG
jgi:hypothetical protein